MNVTGLKHALRPLRPLLLPAWHRIRPLFEGRDDWPADEETAFATDAALAPPIRALTRAEFEAVAARHPYYRSRGRYLSVAAHAAHDLIDRHGLRSAVELGPHLCSIVVGADAIDIRRQPELALAPGAREIEHDARRVPWPIADRAYDLFVGLQVFEHLGTAQPAAFAEVRRIARHAIISLPIDWTMDDPRNCHHQISHERALSWFAPVRPTRVLVGNGGSRKRLVYVFEDLEPPVSAAR